MFSVTQASALVPLLVGAWLACAPPVAAQESSGASRLLCLHGPLSEIAVLLGREHELVGADTTALWPPRLQELPSVGYVRTLSAEGIASLRPDLVLFDEKAGPPPVLAQLKALGLALAEVPMPSSVDEIPARVRRLGVLLQSQGQAERLALAVEADLAASAGRGGPDRRVLFLMQPKGSSLLAAGRGTPAQAVLDHLGLTNVLEDQEGWVRLDGEAALATGPTLLLVAQDDGARAADIELAKLPGLSVTPAAQAGRVFAVDTMASLGLGPRTAPELLALAAKLDPGVAQVPSRVAPLLAAAEARKALPEPALPASSSSTPPGP